MESYIAIREWFAFQDDAALYCTIFAPNHDIAHRMYAKMVLEEGLQKLKVWAIVRRLQFLLYSSVFDCSGDPSICYWH